MRPIFLAFALSLASLPALAQPLLSADQVAASRPDQNLVVLDIRPHEQYEAGHIPGAVPADYEHTGWRTKLPDGSAGALPAQQQIGALIGGLGIGPSTHAVIVSNGDFAAAARVYWTFKVMGHDQVSILDGGQAGWIGSGHALDTANVTPIPANFTPHYNPALRADLPDVETSISQRTRVLVDARPPAQWFGTAKTPVVSSYGHLPGALWINQSDALTPDGRLKPRAELETLFAKIGREPVTTYCNSGHLAATDWFVLSEILGHPDVKLYDGSMSQWTADASRPVTN